MKVTERVEDRVSILVLEGHIDTRGAADLDLALQAAVSMGKYKMILDMAAVKYIGSAGLRALANVMTRNREHGGDLKLVAVNHKVLSILRTIGFDKFFSIHDTLEAAIADF